MSSAPPNLGNVITSARIRAAIYTVYVVAAIVVGAFPIAYAATSAPAPSWVAIATAVIAYLAIPVGGLAAVNTPAARHANQ